MAAILSRGWVDCTYMHNENVLFVPLEIFWLINVDLKKECIELQDYNMY